MDDFFIRALIGSVAIAAVSGPFGAVLVWRKMSYFGSAIAHSALLGVAIALLIEINMTLALLVFCMLTAVLLLLLERQTKLANDTLLGILAHSGLAIGLVAVAFIDDVRVDLMAYLVGDVLALTDAQTYWVCALAIIALLVLALIWRSLIALTVSEELAAVEGVAVTRVKFSYVLLLAGLIAIGINIVGVLLVISLLIIPAAVARLYSSTPEQMAIRAAVCGVISAIAGLYGSLFWDIPAGPAIVVAAAGLFVIASLLSTFNVRN